MWAWLESSVIGPSRAGSRGTSRFVVIKGSDPLGPGQSVVHAPHFKEAWTTVCMLHVSQMFIYSTDLSFLLVFCLFLIN